VLCVCGLLLIYVSEIQLLMARYQRHQHVYITLVVIVVIVFVPKLTVQQLQETTMSQLIDHRQPVLHLLSLKEILLPHIQELTIRF